MTLSSFPLYHFKNLSVSRITNVDFFLYTYTISLCIYNYRSSCEKCNSIRLITSRENNLHKYNQDQKKIINRILVVYCGVNLFHLKFLLYKISKISKILSIKISQSKSFSMTSYMEISHNFLITVFLMKNNTLRK